MATTQANKGSSKSKTKSARTGGEVEATRLLEQQHREVEKLFKAFDKAEGDDEKEKIAGQICGMLKMHTRIEEELFYPEAREAIDDAELVEEAIVEHQGAKDLIAQIEAMEAGEELFDARVKVLCEQINHHVKEEETELFPKCRKSDMDLDAIGRKLAARSAALKKELGLDGGPRGH